MANTPSARASGAAVLTIDERSRLALASVDTSGLGLEIGPSYNPLLPKTSGFRIEIADHASRDELVAKYQAYGLPQESIDKIEEVDHVSQGRSLVETIGRTGAYDYILASNLVEHTVDLIGFLNDCEALLKPNGRLSLIVPDLRYCFDLLRPFTTVGEVVDAHLYPRRFHSPGSLLDHMVYACKRGEAIAWAKTEAAPVELQFVDMGSAKELIQKGLDQAEYVDTHRWKFTPSSFSLLIQDLRELEYHTLVEVAGAPTMGFEFFATLGRPGPQPPYRDRLELLQLIRGEMAAVAQHDGLIPSDGTVQVAPDRATEELARLRSSAAELESATLAMRGERDALLASRSWKITAPLRTLGRVLRRH